MRTLLPPLGGLLALVLMFVLPRIDDRYLRGAGRTVVHPPPDRHVCGACGDDWTPGHACLPPTLVVSRADRGLPAGGLLARDPDANDGAVAPDPPPPPRRRALTRAPRQITRRRP